MSLPELQCVILMAVPEKVITILNFLNGFYVFFSTYVHIHAYF